jgi:hypothetical protein
MDDLSPKNPTPERKNQTHTDPIPSTLSIWVVIRPRPKDRFHPYLTSKKRTTREGRSNHNQRHYCHHSDDDDGSRELRHIEV